ncbi:hypothetical protein AVEN_190371-1 [Araneus ventricosus]|uniref:Uncharacterized protein n=1 Tax=Araneus ventricosus TaxID=182803 RepID=A0A4Y2RL91_ARAVE|nr:hypothetical protein AVEN_190371-1 [Araneus ventricosus]
MRIFCLVSLDVGINYSHYECIWFHRIARTAYTLNPKYNHRSSRLPLLNAIGAISLPTLSAKLPAKISSAAQTKEKTINECSSTTCNAELKKNNEVQGGGAPKGDSVSAN